MNNREFPTEFKQVGSMIKSGFCLYPGFGFFEHVWRSQEMKTADIKNPLKKRQSPNALFKNRPAIAILQLQLKFDAYSFYLSMLWLTHGLWGYISFLLLNTLTDSYRRGNKPGVSNQNECTGYFIWVTANAVIWTSNFCFLGKSPSGLSSEEWP